jgi:catechol 2,3-dioxygenase
MEPLAFHGQLSHIALRVADVDASAEFYADAVGLSWHTGAEPGAARLGWGLGHHALDLLPADDDGAPRLDHFGLEVPDTGELKALVHRARAAGVDVVARAASGDHAEAYEVLDPEGRVIEVHGRVDRAGEFTADPSRRPSRLQHITLATRSVPELLAFYVDVLGLRVSDRMGTTFAWLRCGAEHHTIAMVQADDPSLLDHFSFDLSRWDDFKSWPDRLSTLDIPLSWGPGRHGPGNNVFLMFDDPDGNHVELSAEMELFHDRVARYERTWVQHPLTTNLWGIGPSWRSAARAEA